MKKIKTVESLQEVAEFRVSPDRLLFSASEGEIRQGWTTDIYFIKTREILRAMGLQDTPVVAEIFAGRPGILAGVPEVKNLLAETGAEIWALPEGEPFGEKEVIMRIAGPYDCFGLYETALLGILASSSGWATAARRCKEAAGTKRVVCFGARHVHPAVAPVMERAAIVGGADGA
ncbi:MAG: nicotinate phosphoribosyltransferase, partial [Bacillota bacterium]